MKKNIYLPCIVMIFALVLGSCSVDKRLYRNGYHIEWNNHHPKQESDPEAAAPVVTIPEETFAQNEVPADPELAVPEKELQSAQVEEEQPVVKEKKPGIVARILKEDTPEEIASIQGGNKALAFKSGFKKGIKFMVPDEEVHVFHLAVASFILGLISLVSYYGAFILGLLAIIFGIISLHRIRMSGGAYRGNTFAWIGLICGIIAIAAAAIIIRVY